MPQHSLTESGGIPPLNLSPAHTVQRELIGDESAYTLQRGDHDAVIERQRKAQPPHTDSQMSEWRDPQTNSSRASGDDLRRRREDWITQMEQRYQRPGLEQQDIDDGELSDQTCDSLASWKDPAVPNSELSLKQLRRRHQTPPNSPGWGGRAAKSIGSH